MMNRLLDKERLKLGVCYYPEHWPKEMWKEDLERMADAGIEVIRIAEFAWTKIEPKEGRFDYTFFDESFLWSEETLQLQFLYLSKIFRADHRNGRGSLWKKKMYHWLADRQ